MLKMIEEKLAAAGKFFSDATDNYTEWYENLSEETQYAVALAVALMLVIIYKNV